MKIYLRYLNCELFRLFFLHYEKMVFYLWNYCHNAVSISQMKSCFAIAIFYFNTSISYQIGLNLYWFSSTLFIFSRTIFVLFLFLSINHPHFTCVFCLSLLIYPDCSPDLLVFIYIGLHQQSFKISYFIFYYLFTN